MTTQRFDGEIKFATIDGDGPHKLPDGSTVGRLWSPGVPLTEKQREVVDEILSDLGIKE